ncbi:MAG: hypothetical protein AAF378_11045 [Cyanobacteria bacterium P01_A01_bin.84]
MTTNLSVSIRELLAASSKLAKEKGIYFDSVRAAFLEGEPWYPGSMFRKQNHIQIAVINPNCIKGIFLPREEVPFPSENLTS